MIASLETLTQGLIDYAGLFPPAQLSMSDAVRNFVKYKAGREAWIVGRFVCPVTRISEMEACLGRMGHEKTVPLCVVGRGGETTQEFLRNTMTDIAVARRTATRTAVEVFEMQVPPSAMNPKDIGHLSVELKRRKGDLQVFLEVPITDNWLVDLPMAVETIAITQANGAKLRTGGLVASAVPSVEQVSLFIYECARNGVEMKATAGLHHTVRRFDDTLNCEVHGFLNVFVAAIAAYSGQCVRSLIEDIVGEADPRAFVFEKDGMSCSCPKISQLSIAEGRRFARSFGSCSVAEPVDELAALGHAWGATAK